MGKKPRTRDAGAAHGRAHSVGTAAQPIPLLEERIRPPLSLADLQRGKEGGLPKAVESGGFSERPAAYGAAVDAASANLRLPMEQPAPPSGAIPAVSMLRAANVPDAQARDGSTSTISIAFAHDLGRLVREAREQRGLSQQAFADLVGVGRRFISELENGKPTLELGKVLQVASATGIDLLARPRR